MIYPPKKSKKTAIKSDLLQAVIVDADGSETAITSFMIKRACANMEKHCYFHPFGMTAPAHTRSIKFRY